MRSFVIIRDLNNAQHAAPLDKIAIAAIQDRARELAAHAGGELVSHVLVGVVRAEDEISARLAQTDPNRVLWLYWVDDDGVFRYPAIHHSLRPWWSDDRPIDELDALARWAREPLPLPPSRAHVMSLSPGSSDRAAAAKIWLLAVCATASSRARHEPEPAFLAAINALPDMRPTGLLAPEMRRLIEEAVGIS